MPLYGRAHCGPAQPGYQSLRGRAIGSWKALQMRPGSGHEKASHTPSVTPEKTSIRTCFMTQLLPLSLRLPLIFCMNLSINRLTDEEEEFHPTALNSRHSCQSFSFLLF